MSPSDRRIAAVLALALAVCAPASTELRVPLTLTSRLPFPRLGEPVTSGVPLPQSAGITGADQLRLLDPGGAGAPAQFTVAARWGGAPDDATKAIRWVWVDFRADVSADGTFTYELTSGGSSPPDGITITESADEVAVETGVARFVLDRTTGSLFREVALAGGATLLSAATPSAGRARSDGRTYSTANAPVTVSVELDGPLRSVLQVTGTYRDGADDLLAYTSRYWFYAGESFVRLFHTVENNAVCPKDELDQPTCFDIGSPGSIDVDDLSLTLEPALGEEAAFTAGGDGAPRSGGLTGDLLLYQDSTGSDGWDHFATFTGFDGQPLDTRPRLQSYVTFRGYRLTHDGAQIEAGERALGWLDLSGSLGGITSGVRDFWQNFPKALRGSGPGGLEIGLFPSEFGAAQGYDFNLRAGEHKTHELLLYFHAGDAQAAFSSEQAQAFNDPLFAVAPADWYTSSGALGRTAAADPVGFADYESYNGYTLAEAPIWEPWQDGPSSLPTVLEERSFYGWLDYGDVPIDYEGFGVAPFNLKYNFGLGMWLQWIRTLDPAWFALARAAGRHFADVDILHQPGAPDHWANGAPNGHSIHDEDGFLNPHRNLQGYHPDVGFGLGLWPLYYLTGYDKARQAALEVADNQKARHDFAIASGEWEIALTGQGTEDDGPRPLANILGSMVEAYRATAAPGYLDTAGAVVANSRFVDQPYANGPIPQAQFQCNGMPCDCQLDDSYGNDFVKPWMLNYYLLSIGRYLDLLAESGMPGDPGALRTLTGNLDFLITHVWRQVDAERAAYPYVWCLNGEDQWDDDEPNVNNWLLVGADALAYGFLHAADPRYLDRAAILFGTGTSDPFFDGDTLTYHFAKEATNHANFGHVYMSQAAQLGAGIFADGFESGDPGAWSVVARPPP